jgi:MarR family transcriptional regulator, lower aerobic nicotinate degradation pathway regulator
MSGPPHGAPGLHAALTRHTGYLIGRLGSFASRQFSERLATLHLTTRMWGALNVLDADGPVSQQQLGRAIGMDPSSMVSTIDELESQGLVQRRPNPTDRRAHALHVTDAGRQTLARGRRLAGAAQNDLLAPLDEEERRLLHALLLRVAVGAGAVPTPPAFTPSPGEPAPPPDDG